MDAAEVATGLRDEARSVNERRVLVLTGSRDRCEATARQVLDALSVPITATALVSERDFLRCEQVGPRQAGSILGTTHECIVVDAHDQLRPNTLGQVVGAVDGGGLLVLLAPPLDEWPTRRDDFDAGMAVLPFTVEDVTGHFRERFVETLRAHRGIAIYDVDADTVEADGSTHPAPRRLDPPVPHPAQFEFPEAAYDACRTADQVEAVHDFEFLREPCRALVLEADRGRGKSSAAGIAAGAFAAEGQDVLVTAPSYRNAAEAFDRARELFETLGVAGDHPDENTHLVTTTGGEVRYEPPPEAAAEATEPDLLVVDEAAAISVRLLDETLAADRVAYASTIHGYEGAGRGFSVRFRAHLDESAHEVRENRLATPIRYAAGDPVEVWSFNALGLDARPPVDELVADATVDSVEYGRPTPEDLLADPQRLRETFGLLVLAHYQTQPDDLARLLDAPNLSVRTLTHDGHVVSVALLAREGGLDEQTRERIYEGGRINGNMIPDVLTSQLRDEAAAGPVGERVVRIATHHAARERGLGSHLLSCIREEFADDVDWLGVGYGATPDLLRFWDANDYHTVHLSTTRNDVSGEYSAVMLSPCSPAGEALHDRQADWFARRIGGVLTDALRDMDPDEVRAALAACDADVSLSLDELAWRAVAGTAYGPGLYDVAPGPFRDLVVKHLVDPTGSGPALDAEHERVLVARVLQAHDADAVADELDYHSARMAMRAVGEGLRQLVDHYGDEAAMAERDRHQ
ncbi:tRNA(Met) cytidine acetyltransferase TmcA [Haloarchaeobius amylolyticus]|uniref:tRNA(Met) cytidine acetyltransferase TmcA n=1 Tax=Haloarchaeobius amylolyticus TaxID=1198296 RepID=UPI00226ECC7E|nr:tRNA(Met) cytidine acetyltransferase TmcA [Haloarchaeobius amylolyticus]